MRARDVSRLSSTPYDLLVIGGGIYGLTVAYDAASRGLRTALVEASDFGASASCSHQTTAHVGPHSAGRLGLTRGDIRDRRALARIAPWFLRPLPFIVGTYRSVLKNRLTLHAAFRFDAWLGRHRNDGVEPELHLPAARLVSRAATLKLFDGVNPEGLTGGAQWYDYQIVEGDRLTLAFADAADRAGGDLANHVEAVAAVHDSGRIAGMDVRDRLTGDTVRIRAAVVVNAAGSGAGAVMALFGVRREFPLVKAMSLVTSKPARDMAAAAPAAGGRMLTLVPWHGRAIVGTSQSTSLATSGDTGVSRADVDAFIAEINDAFPALKLTAADVTLVHHGLLPAVVGANGVPHRKPAADILDHASDGAPGAISVVGAKYTAALGIAERVTHAVAKRLGTRVSASRTDVNVLPGAGIADHEALAIETARDLSFDVSLVAIRHLIRLYAEGAADVIRLMHERPDLRAPLSDAVPTVGAEVVYAIRHEMAVGLTDIVVRRTGLGGSGHPGRAAVASCARIAADELKWDRSRADAEIAAVDAVYDGVGAGIPA